MSITKTALIAQTARELGELAEDIRTPVEVFLQKLTVALAAGNPVNLKHFGVLYPDGRWKQAPSLQKSITGGPMSDTAPVPDEPAMVSDLHEMEARILAAIRSSRGSAS